MTAQDDYQLGSHQTCFAHACSLRSLLMTGRWCQQACGKQSDTRTPRKPGSPGLEVTEEQLVAGEEEGAASIVEVYAALLLGFVTESDLAQQKASQTFTILIIAFHLLVWYCTHDLAAPPVTCALIGDAGRY